MQIYKDTWLIKDKIDNTVHYRGESFEDVLAYCSLIIDEFKALVNIDGNGGRLPTGWMTKPSLKEYIQAKKDIFKDAVMYRPYTGDSKTSVWGFLNSGFKHVYMDSRPYGKDFDELIRGLYFRMGSALKDKSFVKLQRYDGKSKLKEFGVEYTDAKFYDMRFKDDDVILAIDQLNYVMLVQETANPIICSHIEIDEVHEDFVTNGMI